MTTDRSIDTLFGDYLARLRAAAADLPPDRQRELEEEIAAHLSESKATGAAHDEASARAVLDRLGHPGGIARAAGEDLPEAVAAAPGPADLRREYAAAFMLTFGSVLLPGLGWLIGIYLLWTSRLWTLPDKVLGTLVYPGGPGVLLVLSIRLGYFFPHAIGVLLEVFLLVLPLIAFAVLLRRASRRRSLVTARSFAPAT